MEPAPELAELVRRLMQAWMGGDIGPAVDAMSSDQGALVIGSDPGEWWKGPETIKAVLRVQSEELPPLDLRFEELEAWREGSVGWVAGRTMFGVTGAPAHQGRLTFVLHQEGAYWRIVQWHASQAVSNVETVGVELTTAVDEILTSVQGERPSVEMMGPDGSVTIVFTDIEGSTPLMEALGEERWLELLEWHHHAVRQQTALFGGSVVKGQGDGFMLAFPAPGSAAACAVALERTLSAGWNGVPVPVRIGMNTGNAKSESGDFFGRTVVVAARVAGAAQGGEILASESVRDGLVGAFPLGACRSLVLKGMSGNHSAYPVLWN